MELKELKVRLRIEFHEARRITQSNDCAFPLLIIVKTTLAAAKPLMLSATSGIETPASDCPSTQAITSPLFNPAFSAGEPIPTPCTIGIPVRGSTPSKTPTPPVT